MRYSIKTINGRKSVEDKSGDKEQRQQIENSNKYDRYYITLNVNGLNTPIKKWIVTRIIKQYPTMHCLQETYFKYKTYTLEVKGQSKI